MTVEMALGMTYVKTAALTVMITVVITVVMTVTHTVAQTVVLFGVIPVAQTEEIGLVITEHKLS